MKKKLLLGSLCALGVLFGQQRILDWQTTVNGRPSVAMLPTTTTVVVSVPSPRFVKVDQINLHNISNASVTVTITDNGSNCNSAPCAVTTPSITIAANTSYTIGLGGQPAAGGVSWSASTANAVEGWIGGRY